MRRRARNGPSMVKNLTKKSLQRTTGIEISSTTELEELEGGTNLILAKTEASTLLF